MAKLTEIVKLTEIPQMGGQGGESVQCLNSESDTQSSHEKMKTVKLTLRTF